jgi:hypothetical protein
MFRRALQSTFGHLSGDYETFCCEAALFDWPKNTAYFAFVYVFCGYRGLR